MEGRLQPKSPLCLSSPKIYLLVGWGATCFILCIPLAQEAVPSPDCGDGLQDKADGCSLVTDAHSQGRDTRGHTGPCVGGPREHSETPEVMGGRLCSHKRVQGPLVLKGMQDNPLGWPGTETLE